MANEPRGRDGPRVTTKSKDDGLTQQAFKEEVDINRIMIKFRKGQVIDHLNRFEGKYADVTGAVDYQEAHAIIARAEEAFMTLPAGIRSDFDNNAQSFLDFAQDPENREAMEDYGLIRRADPENDPEATPPEEPVEAPPEVPAE